MSSFATQLKWQFVLLQKNNIISISIAVTLFYGLILYFLRNIGALDQVLVSIVLNDPAVIGYFFIALAIYIEMKHQILSAIFVSPIGLHQLLLAKTVSISLIGVICSLGLVFPVKGLDFNFLHFTFGSIGICLLSSLLGLFMLTFADEFLKFAILSILLFLAFVNIPLLQYLGAIHIGFIKYLLPIQGSLDLIDYAISGSPIHFGYSYLSIMLLVPLFYWLAYRRFLKKIVHQ